MSLFINSITRLADSVIHQYKINNVKERAFTVAITGIDASGKGYITKLLQEELEHRGYKIANINIDPWQNPIPIRLQKQNPGENFYHNVFRWDDIFEQLLNPLKYNRSIHLTTKLIHTDADVYYDYTYAYENIDFLLIDAILLLQERFLTFYDFKIWIDCSFETGLKRAIKRNVEKLDEEKLIQDYHAYYYAAQKFHIEKDDPKMKADVIFDNNFTGTI